MPRHRARSARIPRQLLRGQKLLDDFTGEEIYSRESSTRFRSGKAYYKKNYDYLTTQEEIEMLQTRLAGTGGTIGHEIGQGYEVPVYTNLETYTNDAAAIKAGLLVGMPYLNTSGTMVVVGGGNVKYMCQPAALTGPDL